MSVVKGIEFEEINRDSVINKTPVLSVWCLTYNHVNYIRDCLDGILEQKTDFDFEIVIYDDASTDGTSAIIREYCKKYPTIIHAFIAKENTYKNPERNKITSYIRQKYMRGKYAALCEGDDYWCDSCKLQMQVNFLQSHSDYILVMHNAKRINYKTNEEDLMKNDELSHEIMPEEIITQKSGIWPTASMVGYKDVLICEPFFFECGIGDWPMQLYAAASGRIYYINKTMSVYRYMHEGSWTERTTSDDKENIIHCSKMVKFLDEYDKYTNDKFHDEIVNRQNIFYYSNLQIIKENRELPAASEKVTENYDTQLVNYLNILERLDKQINDVFYFDSQVFKGINLSNGVFIMGKGKYSDILTKQFLNNGITIHGYVLSDNQIISGDKVISLSRFKNYFADSLLVVGVGIKYYLEVLNILRKNNIKHFVFPFIVNGEIKIN